MENTIENKVKFFAQYYGQHVGIQGSGGGSGFSYEITYHTLDDIRWDYLKLNPLSSITNEDSEGAGINKLKLNQYIQFPYLMTPIMDQILRSKGYALPFMDLSVDAMIEYEWIKLTGYPTPTN